MLSFPRLARRSHALVLLIALASLAACGGSNVLAPRFQPEIVNAADNFSFQATGLQGVTQTLTYTWQMSGTVANVNQASAISTAPSSAMLTVLGPDGATVYSRALSDNGTFVSSAGSSSGTWTIRVTLTNTSGTINFRVQKG